jgi:SAM-dependent methyltransferase
MHGSEVVSPWVARWSHLVPRDVAEGRVLDVACGAGRHFLHFLRQNRRVAGIDIAQIAINTIANQLSTEEVLRAQLLVADVEHGPWPLPGERFAAVIVTNYLWRPLLPTLIGSLAEGGVLIYETFAQGNETVGKPSRADFLLKPGELLSVCQAAGLRVVAFEDGFLPEPDRFVQRVVAFAPKNLGGSSPTDPLNPQRCPL